MRHGSMSGIIMQNYENMSDADLIAAVQDKGNWTDPLLLEVRQRVNDDRFYDRLYDAISYEGIGTLTAAIDSALEKEQPVVTTKNGMVTKEVHTLAKLVKAADVEEQEASWLIPGYIPRYQITTLAADGGIGKTTIECELTAAVTTGRHSFMTDGMIPDDFKSDPENVLFLSAEDSFRHVLKRKLRKSGADMERVFTANVSDPGFLSIKFNSPDLVELIKEARPGLVIFDPIQNFVPPDIQMGWRNAMRQCLNPLIGIGEEYKTTFLIACHTNKQSGVSGRRRIAESADIWDISRSVLMAGETPDTGIKYLSHEKCNYGELQQTILFTIDDDRVILKGRTDLHDADYCSAYKRPKASPARDDAKELILICLKEHDGKMKSSELDEQVIANGVSPVTMKRAKAELKKEKQIIYFKSGFSDEWYTKLPSM